MPLFHQIKDTLLAMANTLGYEIYKRPYLPKGADAFLSLRAHWPEFQPMVIFDVGANVGQSVERLRPLFPQSRIHSFEPVPATYQNLVDAVQRDNLVTTHPFGLSDHIGSADIFVHPFSEQSSLTAPTSIFHQQAAERRVTIALDTVDATATRLGITQLGIIKIDVEGHESAVLNGAGDMLAKGAIDFLVLEAGLIPGNPRFAPLSELASRLQRDDYWLIGIYEQFGMRFPQTAEFCNALFAHRSHLEENPLT